MTTNSQSELLALTRSYLATIGYNPVETAADHVVFERRVAGDRDVRIIWALPQYSEVSDFAVPIAKLVDDFAAKFRLWQGARGTVLAPTLEGITREFRRDAAKNFVRILRPVEFFDTSFRHEEGSRSPSRTRDFADRALARRRVRQRFRLLEGGREIDQSGDLLDVLRKHAVSNELSNKLFIVIGPAGVGKSILFQALFTELYDEFMLRKSRGLVGRRPLPLIPAYKEGPGTPRLRDLVESFISSDFSAKIPAETFEWMILNGFGCWMLDGLDELYSGDPDFFNTILDLLTAPGGRARIVLFARESLLTVSTPFREFMSEYGGDARNVVVYKLADWDTDAKRDFAWINLLDKPPQRGVTDPQPVRRFMQRIETSPTLWKLTDLPYYCGLFLGQYRANKDAEFSDEYDLLDRATSGMIDREFAKGVVQPAFFELGGLEEWLEQLAVDHYSSEARGVDLTNISEYGRLVMRPELSESERNDALIGLLQFPFFERTGSQERVAFKHELVAEFFAAKAMARRVAAAPDQIAHQLGRRIDLSSSLIARLLAGRLSKDQRAFDAAAAALRTGNIRDRGFANLLQVLLLSDARSDLIKRIGTVLERKDLQYVHFKGRDFSGISFRYCDLSNTSFEDCNLAGASFEGATLSGTRFADLPEEALRRADFGNLERFEYVFTDGQTCETREQFAAWAAKWSGRDVTPRTACPAAEQLRVLFLKFVRPDGNYRRDEHTEAALLTGKHFSGAPSYDQCLRAAVKFGFISGPNYRNRYRRTAGAKYDEVVGFVRDWKASLDVRRALDEICRDKTCTHLPD